MRDEMLKALNNRRGCYQSSLSEARAWGMLELGNAGPGVERSFLFLFLKARYSQHWLAPLQHAG
jgi:hypothetical protein